MSFSQHDAPRIREQIVVRIGDMLSLGLGKRALLPRGLGPYVGRLSHGISCPGLEAISTPGTCGVCQRYRP